MSVHPAAIELEVREFLNNAQARQQREAAVNILRQRAVEQDATLVNTQDILSNFLIAEKGLRGWFAQHSRKIWAQKLADSIQIFQQCLIHDYNRGRLSALDLQRINDSILPYVATWVAIANTPIAQADRRTLNSHVAYVRLKYHEIDSTYSYTLLTKACWMFTYIVAGAVASTALDTTVLLPFVLAGLCAPQVLLSAVLIFAITGAVAGVIVGLLANSFNLGDNFYGSRPSITRWLMGAENRPNLPVSHPKSARDYFSISTPLYPLNLKELAKKVDSMGSQATIKVVIDEYCGRKNLTPDDNFINSLLDQSIGKSSLFQWTLRNQLRIGERSPFEYIKSAVQPALADSKSPVPATPRENAENMPQNLIASP